MNRRRIAIVVVVVGLVGTGVGVFYTPPEGHRHVALGINDDVVTDDNGTVDPRLVQLHGDALGYPDPELRAYANLSPTARRLFRRTVARGNETVYWTPPDVDPPEYDYSMQASNRSLADGTERVVVGHLTYVVVGDESRPEMAEGYSMGRVVEFRTETGKPGLLSARHVPTFVTPLVGLPLLVLGGYLRYSTGDADR